MKFFNILFVTIAIVGVVAAAPGKKDPNKAPKPKGGSCTSSCQGKSGAEREKCLTACNKKKGNIAK